MPSPSVAVSQRITRLTCSTVEKRSRRVIEALRPFDFTLCVYDPYLSAEEAERLGVEPGRCGAASKARRASDGGLRLLFGDQVMITRRETFWAAGGFDEALPLLEDGDLCLRLQKQGRIDSMGPADYQENSQTFMWLWSTVQEIADRIVKQREQALGSKAGEAPRHLND